MTETTTFLMFCGPHTGQAEEAITLYISLLKNSEIIAIDRYGANERSQINLTAGITLKF